MNTSFYFKKVKLYSRHTHRVKNKVVGNINNQTHIKTIRYMILLDKSGNGYVGKSFFS